MMMGRVLARGEGQGGTTRGSRDAELSQARPCRWRDAEVVMGGFGCGLECPNRSGLDVSCAEHDDLDDASSPTPFPLLEPLLQLLLTPTTTMNHRRVNMSSSMDTSGSGSGSGSGKTGAEEKKE